MQRLDVTDEPAGAGSSSRRTSGLVVGISGAARNAAVAACLDGELVAACEQERVTRLRRAGVRSGSFPGEALETVLRLAGDRKIADVRRFATAEVDLMLPAGAPAVRFGHHRAHAATAFFTSSFTSATVLICDHHSSPSTTVWSASGNTLGGGTGQPDGSTSLAGLYSEAARIMGLQPGQEHELEALARLDAAPDEHRFDALIRYEDGSVRVSGRWQAEFSEWLSSVSSDEHRIRVAGEFQRHLGRILLALVSDVRAAHPGGPLCLGGGLFYNTFFTTLIHRSRLFDDLFVAPNPGNAGLAVGLAILAAGGLSSRTGTVSPFLGPEYGLEEIKDTLDNCKLSYEYLSESDTIEETVDELRRGRLVGWFQGRMEWGHRALGNRSILASPLSPYVLDNLNTFLKHRDRHRAYGFSVPESDAMTVFRGPRSSRFMEFEYDLADDRLRHAVPRTSSAIRVQTIPDATQSFRRFHMVHKAFGQATGVPVLVNTSFNGFAEPIVCSPRDAIRAFFSTGLDVLVLDRFVVRK